MYPLLGEGSRVPGASWHPEQLTEPVWAPVVPVIKLGPQSTQCWEKLVGNFPRSWSDLIIHLPTASGTCADPESLPLDVQMSLLVWMEGDGGSSTDEEDASQRSASRLWGLSTDHVQSSVPRVWWSPFGLSARHPFSLILAKVLQLQPPSNPPTPPHP